ncbi:MAG: hypothetical protein R3B06_30190 [Kofleriaceae bacterium]
MLAPFILGAAMKVAGEYPHYGAGLAALGVWLVAIAAVGRIRYRIYGDRVTVTSVGRWWPVLRRGLRGQLMAARVHLLPRGTRLRPAAVPLPESFAVGVRSRRGERLIAAGSDYASASALAAAIDLRLGLVDPCTSHDDR